MRPHTDRGGITHRTRAASEAILFFLILGHARAQAPDTPPAPRAGQSSAILQIPRVSAPPKLEHFAAMRAAAELESQFTKVTAFTQERPKDGEPASQRTEAYLGYDDLYLYVIFVAFDSEPGKIRARLTKRENAFSDDFVEVTLDTFSDRRRGYLFWSNPLGVQAEARWNEDRGGPDFSFDTLWHSRGQLTEQGYIVWMAIPWKSLRFPSVPEQSWGITLLRVIPRVNEWSYWPHVSSRIDGRLNQAGTAKGLENLAPGRNLQFIPFGVFRSFRALDERDRDRPRFVDSRADPDSGLDTKIVIRDRLVLDLTLNPDFSQVESDEPQVTVNQRFEVFFPEKRPFFLENSDFFQTPINLVFTRRIADPMFGARLTGKTGPYAIGAMVIDDESPGKRVTEEDPLSGKRATFGIFRISRDLFRQSSLALIFTDREFQGSYNRVGGIDGRFKLDDNWVARLQAVTSSTESLDGDYLAGPAYEAGLSRNGRQFNYSFLYRDRSPGFRTLTGFDPRPDIRDLQQFVQYNFRPEKKHLVSWGPAVGVYEIWDHRGNRLNRNYDAFLRAELGGQTFLSFGYAAERELLRPEDFSLLQSNRDYSPNTKSLFFTSSYIRQLTVQGSYRWGTRINYAPVSGKEPELGGRNEANLNLVLRPTTGLQIDNSYILLRLTDPGSGASIVNNHIMRSRLNWQFSREVSIRTIFQYETLLANSAFTTLKNSRSFNADFLFTYQANPWTALYVGYNSNLRDIDLIATATGAQILTGRGRLINDSRQFFVKFSYLFRL